MSKHMETYSQYLAARYLSESLLQKHAQEASLGSCVIHGDVQVEEEFRKVASRLGFRVEKIEASENTEAEPDQSAARCALAYLDAGRGERA